MSCMTSWLFVKNDTLQDGTLGVGSTVKKGDLVKLLMKQPYNKDLSSTTSWQSEKHAIISRSFQHWEEHINPEKLIESYLEEMWLLHSNNDCFVDCFVKVSSYIKEYISSSSETIAKDDFLKYIFIKSIENYLFTYIEDLDLDPILKRLLRVAWKIMLHENISNCYANEECRNYVVKLTIQEVCMALVEMTLQPGIFGLKTITLPLKGVAYEILAYLAQIGLEYYDNEDLSKVLGIVGDIVTSHNFIGTAVGSAVCPVVGDVAEKILKSL